MTRRWYYPDGFGPVLGAVAIAGWLCVIYLLELIYHPVRLIGLFAFVGVIAFFYCFLLIGDRYKEKQHRRRREEAEPRIHAAANIRKLAAVIEDAGADRDFAWWAGWARSIAAELESGKLEQR